MSTADDVAALRAHLDDLMAHAHLNQQILRRHQMMDLALIGAASFRELIDTIFLRLKESSELDVVTLSLIDADYSVRRILADLQIKLTDFPHLLFIDDHGEIDTLQPLLHQSVLGLYSEQLHGAMFPDPIPVPSSVAIVPLIRNRQLIGCLNFGSFDAQRFAHDMATDFIEHLSSILAICIENVINHERLKHMGMTDPLTGVNNRRYIERRLVEDVDRIRRQKFPLSCLYIDIDHFKKINDTWGHKAGDDVLREVAGRIQAELRLSDALGRFGGEEFLALLTDAETADSLLVGERIRASVAETPIRVGQNDLINLTVSIGVATLTPPIAADDTQTICTELIALADRYLYAAKQGGRNRVIGGF